MPRRKTTLPTAPSRETGQRTLDLPLYLNRYMPAWNTPEWMEADRWRNFVAAQPVAVLCKDALINFVNSLDWQIVAKDSNKRDELKKDIEYYTKLFQHDGILDYVARHEWILNDALDTPFGGAEEVIREGDKPDGKVKALIPIDAATLFPVLDIDYPVAQYLKELPGTPPVLLPKHAVNRIAMTPHSKMKYEGWAIAPPQRIYMAVEMLNLGDKYYAKMLFDTPPSGILDLFDMTEQSAAKWVEGFRELLFGVDPFKIPVLYEHTVPAKFIPFSLNPADLDYKTIINMYASLVTAGYGLTTSDIGFSVSANGGETLSGTIRQERLSRRNGISRLKNKLKAWYNRLLPDTLEFKWVDYDEESTVAMGRSRLANATAWSTLVSIKAFTPNEARQQMMADGLVTISIPEEVDESEFPEEENPFGGGGGFGNNGENGNFRNPKKQPERPNELGRPIAPSQGGFGDVTPKSILGFEKALLKTFHVDEIHSKKLFNSLFEPVKIDVQLIKRVKDFPEDVIAESFSKEEELIMSSGDGNETIKRILEVSKSRFKSAYSLIPDKAITDSDIISPIQALISVHLANRFSEYFDNKYIYEDFSPTDIDEMNVGIVEMSSSLIEEVKSEVMELISSDNIFDRMFRNYFTTIKNFLLSEYDYDSLSSLDIQELLGNNYKVHSLLDNVQKALSKDAQDIAQVLVDYVKYKADAKFEEKYTNG